MVPVYLMFSGERACGPRCSGLRLGAKRLRRGARVGTIDGLCRPVAWTCRPGSASVDVAVGRRMARMNHDAAWRIGREVMEPWSPNLGAWCMDPVHSIPKQV